MKQILFVAILFITTLILIMAFIPASQALPEYSAQTGEPCAACHISPSGGGLRTPRGQAWVGGGRPGAVPARSDALAALGVRLRTNEQDFIAAPRADRPAPRINPPAAAPHGEKVRSWLRSYEGN